MMPSDLRRAPLLGIALLTMLWGAWLGVARIGWRLPLPGADHVLWHGPLLVGGFFGTLITLERAIGLGVRWGYAGPLLTALGAVLLAAGRPQPAALAITLASAISLVGATLIVRRRGSLAAWIGGAGAVAWLAGNAQWLAGAPVFEVVHWWAGFLVLSIVGTRLGRSQPLAVTGASLLWFGSGVLLLLLGIVLTGPARDTGVRVAGIGLFLLAAWLSGHDSVRRTLHQPGFDRYMALAVLAAYVWLAAGGLMALAFGGVTVGPRYDALLHAVLLGFVISMVFAHAPLIFPTILGLALPFRPIFYAHLALLHLSLVVRIIGDLTGGATTLRAWGGLLNAVAILLFVANMARSAALGATRSAVLRREP